MQVLKILFSNDIIQKDLAVVEELLMDSLAAETEFARQAGQYIIKSGGKRLRPALFLLAARCGKNFDLNNALPLAAALELIHTASLVHDDVIDEADLRRGVPTANAKWGRRVSILTGDFIFAVAFRLVSKGNYNNSVSSRLADLVADLSEGEIVESREAYSGKADLDGYLWRIKKKTANFLEICLELGGMVGGADKETTAALAAYGHNIGMAFQIKDDILDIDESAEQIGKPVGNDIRQGVLTLPVIRALLTGADKEELQSLVTNAAMTDEDAARAVAIVRQSDGTEFAKQYAADYIKRAKDALPSSIPLLAKKTFLKAADFIAERNR